jgi:RNA polymerase sigma-70 factor (ECF subfamily)
MDTADRDAQDRADMARLAGGHDAALNDLMDRHAQRLFHFLCRMLGNEDDANDLAQETFVRVFQHRATYKPDYKFGTWLFTIAANLSRNHLRWRSRHPTTSLDTPSQGTDQNLGGVLPASDPSPTDAAVTEERTKAVRAAVQSLPDDLREAIVLCEWDDLTLADAAAVLQTTPKAVESRLYRARNLLREELKKWL